MPPSDKAKPAPAIAVNGLRDDDLFGGEVNIAIPRIAVAANRRVIVSVRRRPYGKPAWLLSIKDVCTDTPIRDCKLRRYRRFCYAIKHRPGVTFDPMPRADWLAIVEVAIAEGGEA